MGEYEQNEMNPLANPSVSLLIPVRNEKSHIETTLRHCVEQNYPSDRYEVLLADGMSDDGTREIVRRFIEAERGNSIPEIRIIDNPEFIVPTGINRALKASQSDVIIVMGAHAEYDSKYIAECVRVLYETGAENVGGPALAIAKGYVARAVAAAYNSPFSVGGARFHNVNFEGYVDTVTFGCWRREYLLSMGGYDEEFVRNQDDELNLRTILGGGKIYQSPTIVSRYYTRNSLGKLFRQQFQYGYWKVRVIQKHKRPASIRHLVPILFVAGLVVGAILSFVHPTFAWTYASVLSLYGILNLLFSIKAAANRGFELVVLLPFVFFIYHLAYGLGFVVGLLDFVVTRKKLRGLFGGSAQSLTR